MKKSRGVDPGWRGATLSGAVPRRTIVLTVAPCPSRALAIRPPRLPVAPARTTDASMIVLPRSIASSAVGYPILGDAAVPDLMQGESPTPCWTAIDPVPCLLGMAHHAE